MMRYCLDELESAVLVGNLASTDLLFAGVPLVFHGPPKDGNRDDAEENALLERGPRWSEVLVVAGIHRLKPHHSLIELEKQNENKSGDAMT